MPNAFSPAPRLKLTTEDRKDARRLAWKYMGGTSLLDLSPNNIGSVLWAIYTLSNPEEDEVAEIVLKARAYASEYLTR